MEQYTSTFVRYERRGDKVVPVRVTKQWVTAEGMRGKLKAKAFQAVRVTELRHMPRGDREQAPEAWTSSLERVETRERLLGLVTNYALEEGGEPVLVPVGAGQDFLPVGNLSNLTKRQADAPMDAEPESREWYLRRQWAELRGHEDETELEAA